MARQKRTAGPKFGGPAYLNSSGCIVSDFITFSELKKAYEGVLSQATLRRYLRDGRIDYIQPAGRKGKLLIPRSAIDSLRRMDEPENTVVHPGTTQSRSPRRPQWSRRLGGRGE